MPAYSCLLCQERLSGSRIHWQAGPCQSVAKGGLGSVNKRLRESVEGTAVAS